MSVRPHHFRRRSARALYEDHHGPNMTPMVDVVMVILIFFMASAVVLGPEWFVPARLPKAGAVRETIDFREPVRVHVRVLRDPASGRGVVSINDGPTRDVGDAGEGVRSLVAGVDPQLVQVLIDPAPDAPYEDVVRVHAGVQALGLPRVGLGSPAALSPK